MVGNSTTTDLGGATIPEFDLDEGDFLTFETETKDINQTLGIRNI